MTRARGSLILAGPDLRRLAELSAQLGSLALTPILAQTESPLGYLTDAPDELSAAIACLTGLENVGDFHQLFALRGGLPVVFLALQFPPPPSVARLVAAHGGQVLAADENAVVVAATLLALIYQRQSADRQES